MPIYDWIFPQSPFIGLERPVRVVAVAEDYSYHDKTGNGFWCLCRTEEINEVPQDGHTVIEVYFKTKRLALRPGDRVEFDAELLSFENSDDFLEFTYYKTRFIDAKAFAERYEVFPNETIPIRYYPKVLSNSIRERIDDTFGSAAGLIRALITGDRRMLTDRQTENFRITGLSHVVAVSGMHVAFLVGFIVLLFGRRRAPLIAVPIILLFGMMIGPIPSVMRAIFMQFAVLFAPILKKDADSLTSLAGALGFILILNPYAILDIGLQLSFGATLGLILYSQRLNDHLFSRVKAKHKILRKVLRYLISTFAASICAMIFTTPIVMSFFRSFSWIAPLSNVLTLWSVSVMFVGGIVVVLLSYVSFYLAYYIAIPIKALAVGFLWGVDLLAKIPYALLYAGNPIVVAFVVYAYTVFLWVVHAKRRTPRIRVVFTMILIPLIMTVSVYAYIFARVTSVSATVLDVGHGQSVLVESFLETVLIDCGSQSQDAANILCDKLLERSERTIDAFVLTHLDRDHMSGAEEILGRLRVARLYLHADLSTRPEFERLQACAAANGTELVLVRFETEVSFSNIALTIYPVKEGKDPMLGINVSYETVDLLVTGDMSVKGERSLIDSYELPDVEHYIAGHHGSKGSSSEALLDAVTPECAYISVNAENQYGHPHDETLERFSVRNIPVYRTDLQGNIEIKF